MATDLDTLAYDHLSGGELVAVRSHDGQTVAAIVHPRTLSGYRWCLAGDVDRANRPQGHAVSIEDACCEAAEALGDQLGIDIEGWTQP